MSRESVDNTATPNGLGSGCLGAGRRYVNLLKRGLRGVKKGSEGPPKSPKRKSRKKRRG